jgi:N-acetylneuraminic acid mutarotase
MRRTTVNRSLALLVSTLMLASCSSDNEVRYTVIDGMAVIETETWTSKQDSAQLTWTEAATDNTLVAQLGSRTTTSTATDATLSAVATARYDVDVSTPNLYYLWVRARVDNDEAIAVDNSTVLTLAITTDTDDLNWQITGFNDQWQWIAMDTNQTMLSANIITAGVYELSVAAEAKNLLVDKIVLTDQPGYAPTDEEPVTTIADSGTDSSADTEAGPTDDQDANSDQTEESDSTNNDATPADDASLDDNVSNSPSEEESGNVDPGNMNHSEPPVVTIDGDTSVETGQALVLTATTDSDPADGTIYYYWDQTLGNGVATFNNIKSQSPTMTFDLPGAYVIQVTAANDAGYSNASVNITVSASTNTQSETTNNDDSTSDSSPDNSNNETSNTSLSDQNISPAHQWRSATARGSATKRHETSGVAVDGKMYVIGGRGNKPVDVWDSATNTWSQAARPPLEMHHFQAVAIDHIIYVVGAATCCYPVETNIANVYQFDTISGNWSKGAAIPGNRLRGSTAAAVYNRKIYIVGGNTRGHSGGAVNWFDEFDPATGQWRALANAPDARDHATIAVVGDQLVVAGGRQSNYPNTFGNTVARTNVYDFKQQRWQTAANIPTQRAGTMAVGLGSELVVIGGESLASSNAHNAVEAFDIFSRSWRRLNPLPTPRHGGAAAVINQNIHVVAGSKQRGGAPETEAHEILK